MTFEGAGLSSNTGLPRASWSVLAETSNTSSQRQEAVFDRRRTVLRFVAAVGMVCAVPSSANVRPNFDLLGVTRNASVVSGLMENVVLSSSESDYDVRDTYPLVRRTFGGNMLQTASFYGVTRKTLYQWLGSEEAPRIRERQMHRSMALVRIAQYAANTLGDTDGSLTRVTEHRALGDLLSANALDEQAVLSCLHNAKSSSPVVEEISGRRTLAHRLATAGAVLPPGKEDLDLLI